MLEIYFFNSYYLTFYAKAELVDFTNHHIVEPCYCLPGLQGNYSDILRFADNPIVNLTLCEQNYAVGTVTEKHICASTTGARGPCRVNAACKNKYDWFVNADL